MYSSSNSEVTEPTSTPSQFSQLFSCLTSTMPSPTEPPGPRGTNAINHVSDTNKEHDVPSPRDKATQLGVGVSGRGIHSLPVEFPPLAAFERAGILSMAPGEALPGTFMITDEHRRDDDDEEGEEEEDEILFMRSTPNSSHASSSRVGTISRSRYSMLGTTQRDGNDESDSDSDSDSDGGAPLFTPPSRDKTPGKNSNHEENRRAKRSDGGSEDLGRPAQHELVDRHHHHHQQFQHGHHRANNSNIKADAAAQIIHYHCRPKTLLASFRPGIPLPLGVLTEPDYDVHPAYFSTRFIVKRAVARVQARRLNRSSIMDHFGGNESLIGGIGRQQTNDVEQHHIKGRGRGTYYKPPASPPYVITRQAFSPLTTITTTRKTNYCSRPPPPTTTTTAPPTENPTTGTSTTTRKTNDCSVQLGPFTLSPSDVALLASSEASFKRLTTPKLHPAFSGGGISSCHSRQVSPLVLDSAEEWMDGSLGVGAKFGPKKKEENMKEVEEEEGEEEKEEEEEGEDGEDEEEEEEEQEGEGEEEGKDEEEWEWVDHPMDKYRVGCMDNPMGRDRAYARNRGFGRREEE